MMLSEAGHWVYWLWGLLGETLLLPNIRCCLTGPGQRVLSYKVTHSLLLPLLGLGEHGKGQAGHQGWLLLASVSGVSKGLKVL